MFPLCQSAPDLSHHGHTNRWKLFCWTTHMPENSLSPLCACLQPHFHRFVHTCLSAPVFAGRFTLEKHLFYPLHHFNYSHTRKTSFTILWMPASLICQRETIHVPEKSFSPISGRLQSLCARFRWTIYVPENFFFTFCGYLCFRCANSYWTIYIPNQYMCSRCANPP